MGVLVKELLLWHILKQSKSNQAQRCLVEVGVESKVWTTRFLTIYVIQLSTIRKRERKRRKKTIGYKVNE